MSYIYLNDQKLPIFRLDTIESLKARLAAEIPNIPNIASMNKTLLPSLIKLDLQENDEIVQAPVGGCISEKISSTDLHNKKFIFTDFYTTISTILPAVKGNGQTEIDNIMKEYDILNYQTFLMYVLYFYFENMETFRSLRNNLDNNIRRIILTGIQTYFDIGSIDNVSITFNIEADNIKKLINTNISFVEEDIKFFQMFDKYLSDDEREESKVQIEKTSLLVKFKINGDLYDLFNTIILSRNIPYAQLGNFYKLTRDFKPPKEWLEDEYEEDVLILYILNKSIEPEKNKNETNPELYSPIFIVSSDFENTNKQTDVGVLDVEMTIESKVSDELKEENLLDRIFSSFQNEIRIKKECSVKQLWIECDYLSPLNTVIEAPLFYDMIMNDTLISKFFIINESSNIFRERGGIPVYFRYNRYTNPWDYILFRLDTIKIGPRQQARAPSLFTAGKYTITLDIHIKRVSNLLEVERIKTIINSLINYYFGKNTKLIK